MKLKSKLFASAVAFTMVLSMVAIPASAQTTAELTAQINSLLAMIAQLQAQIAGQGGTVAQGTAVQFNTDLTVGSKGADVTALQQFLVSKGYLQMPAGVSYGYFGSITKAALAAYQTAAGITPAVGYFGPITRAKVNAAAGTTGTTGGTTACPTGYTCTSNTSGTISTPGAEGTLTVTAGTVPNSIVYSEDTMDAVLAFKVKAQSSDIAVQRVKLDLGTDSNIYRRAYSKIYLVDEANNVLASSDLNSDTVTKSSAATPVYYITLTGFSSVVPKDATKTYTVKVDVRSFSSTDTSLQSASWTIGLAADGVRGVDGAGIDQYSGGSDNDISKAIQTQAPLSDSASLTLATGSNTPLTQEVIAADGSSNNQADKVTLLTFDVKATKDTVLLTDLIATVSRSAGLATASSTYLYDGSTLVGTASLAKATATFSDINVSIPKDTTKTFTLKADIQSAGTVQTTITSSVASAGLSAENSVGDAISGTLITGSATGNSILVTNAGPVFSLVGTPTITRTVTSNSTYSTSTAAATFQLHIKAVGAAVVFGDLSTTTGTGPMTSNKAGFVASFLPYLNGTAGALIVASTTDFSVPSSGVTIDSGNKSFTLAQDGEVTIPVTFSFQAKTTAGVDATYGSYSIGLERVNWGGTASTFMSGQTNWRSSSVTLP